MCEEFLYVGVVDAATDEDSLYSGTCVRTDMWWSHKLSTWYHKIFDASKTTYCPKIQGKTYISFDPTKTVWGNGVKGNDACECMTRLSLVTMVEIASNRNSPWTRPLPEFPIRHNILLKTACKDRHKNYCQRQFISVIFRTYEMHYVMKSHRFIKEKCMQVTRLHTF